MPSGAPRKGRRRRAMPPRGTCHDASELMRREQGRSGGLQDLWRRGCCQHHAPCQCRAPRTTRKGRVDRYLSGVAEGAQLRFSYHTSLFPELTLMRREKRRMGREKRAHSSHTICEGHPLDPPKRRVPCR
eukprot:3756832-Rhodomonas_salina.1